MKLLIIITALITCISTSYAQINITVPTVGCPINTISTDPTHYNNSSDPTAARKWDWMANQYDVYYQEGTGTPGVLGHLVSPYWETSTNPNTVHFVDQPADEKDYSPKNGWELLGRNFGTPLQGIKNPYFLLYNKYTGVVRVFVNLKNSGGVPYNAATITLSFKNGGGKRRTAIFNQLGNVTNAVNKINPYAKVNIVNEYINSGVSDNNFWLWGDFVSLYDPCTCGVESDFTLEVKLISETIVTLSVNGVTTTIVDAPATGAASFDNSAMNTIKQYLDFGSGLVSDVGGIVSAGNKGYATGTKLQTDANVFINHANGLLGNNTAAVAEVTAGLLFEVPNVNAYLMAASALITVIKKINGDFSALTADQKLNKVSNTTLTTVNTNLKVTGNMIQSGNFVNELIALPSSIQTGLPDFRKPIYNNTLGVINLVEQPVVKITKYTAPSTLYYQVGSGSGSYLENNNVIEVFPPVIHAEIKDEIKLALNPASGLKLKSVESKIEFIHRESNANKIKGLMVPGLLKTFNNFGFLSASISDREAYYDNLGYNVELFNNPATSAYRFDNVLMSTPYIHQGCFKKTSLFSYSTMEKINVKIKVILEPIVTDPNSNVDDIIMILSYPATIENVNGGAYQIEGSIDNVVYDYSVSALPLKINLPGFIYDPSMNTTSTSIFTNKIIDHDYFIDGDLTIGENVTFVPGTFNISATGNIKINSTPLFQTTVVPINFSLYNLTFTSANSVVVENTVTFPSPTVLQINQSIATHCEYTEPYSVPMSDIATYCNSSSYNTLSAPRMLSFNDNEDNLENTQEAISNSNISFSLFPNPTKESSIIKIENINDEDVKITIMDLTGKLIDCNAKEYDRNTYILNTSDFSQGVYFVKVSSLNGSQTKQLIIQ